jgi:hypothetical protein
MSILNLVPISLILGIGLKVFKAIADGFIKGASLDLTGVKVFRTLNLFSLTAGQDIVNNTDTSIDDSVLNTIDKLVVDTAKEGDFNLYELIGPNEIECEICNRTGNMKPDKLVNSVIISILTVCDSIIDALTENSEMILNSTQIIVLSLSYGMIGLWFHEMITDDNNTWVDETLSFLHSQIREFAIKQDFKLPTIRSQIREPATKQDFKLPA